MAWYCHNPLRSLDNYGKGGGVGDKDWRRPSAGPRLADAIVSGTDFGHNSGFIFGAPVVSGTLRTI